MNHKIQSRLLQWAAIFLFIQSAILTLSPAVRERTWDVEYRLSHWAGLFLWCLLTFLTHRILIKKLPEHDPYIFPAASLLSGWGLITIWRLDPTFGLRQTIWLGISLITLVLASFLLQDLSIFKRYKYIFLSSGLLITALTLIFGTNPLGIGPQLWLGIGGVYFQPSEPLKILLVIYLSAYLAERATVRLSSLPLVVPTFFVTSLALLLLIVQRDLGTASIFVFIFTILLFIASDKRRVLIITATFLSIALLLGYSFIELIKIRVIGWLNPWEDPTGNSYQIIQSLLAVANGGVIGKGLGMGSPLLVPVAISDFIFAAIAEETGLIGTIAIIITIWVILSRGILIALRATDSFRRYLATGIVAYLGVQSLLIMGGNLRLLPLTGVTLPFVSYGGSSLLTSFIALYLLIAISHTEEKAPAPISNTRPYTLLASMFALALFASALTGAWWAIIRSNDLLARTDNPRRAIADRYVPRGNIVDTNNQPINITNGKSGSFTRTYMYPDLASITGYTHPVFGQAGLEAEADHYLRGLQGNPASLILWNQALYGTPPAGLDLRLSIDLSLQKVADELLGEHSGAIILMNAETGEILIMASHPTYDPNLLDEQGNALSQDKKAPLLNRATQGLYPIGTILQPLEQAYFGEKTVTSQNQLSFYQDLGLFSTPALYLPVSAAMTTTETQEMKASPIQVVLATASLNNQGIIPAARIATAVNTPEQGWVVLPAQDKPNNLLQPSAAINIISSLVIENQPFWSHQSTASLGNTRVNWMIAGTPPDWQGTPLALVILIENENDEQIPFTIGKAIFNTALSH